MPRRSRKDKTTCPCCGEGRVDRILLSVVDIIVELFGACRISSGYRCRKHNKEVGGSENSAHLYECAVDLVFESDKSKLAAYKVLNKVWDGGLGLYNTHIHLDKMRRRRWQKTTKNS